MKAPYSRLALDCVRNCRDRDLVLPPHGTWHCAAAALPWTAALESAFRTPAAGVLTLCFRSLLRTSTAWAAAGTSIGAHSFAITPRAGSTCALATSRPTWDTSLTTGVLSLSCLAGDGWLVTGEHSCNGLSVHVDGQGVLRSYVCDQHELLTRGPLPSLWRAPTDNDEFGRFADSWRAVGLHQMERVLEGLQAWQPTAHLVCIQADWRLTGSRGHRLGVVSFTYVITADGELELCANTHLEVGLRRAGALAGEEELPVTIPRLGVSLEVPKRLQAASWFGFGPHENYPDRRASAALGQWSASVPEMHTPYTVPSENGGRGGVRWLALLPGMSTKVANAGDTFMSAAGDDAGMPDADCGGSGLLVMTGPLTAPMQMSVSPYSIDALTQAKHEAELRESEEVCLRVYRTSACACSGDREYASVMCATGGARSCDGCTHLCIRQPCNQRLPPMRLPSERAAPRTSPQVVHVHLDAHHMGVGGHDSWTPLRTIGENYFVQPTLRSTFRLRMLPLSAATDAARLVAARRRPMVHSGTTVMFRALPPTVHLPGGVAGMACEATRDLRYAFADFRGYDSSADSLASLLVNTDRSGSRDSFGQNDGVTPTATTPSEGMEDGPRNAAIAMTALSGDGTINLANDTAAIVHGSPSSIGSPELDSAGADHRWTTDDSPPSRTHGSEISHACAGDESASEYSSAQTFVPPVTAAEPLIVERDVFLRVAGNQVGIAALPSVLPSTHRHLAGLTVEKKSGGPVLSGNTVTLRASNNFCIEVEAEAAAARWTIPGEWQSFQIERYAHAPPMDQTADARADDADPRMLHHGDVVCLRAHTGNLLRSQTRRSDSGGTNEHAMPLQATAYAPLRHGNRRHIQPHTKSALERELVGGDTAVNCTDTANLVNDRCSHAACAQDFALGRSTLGVTACVMGGDACMVALEKNFGQHPCRVKCCRAHAHPFARMDPPCRCDLLCV